ncbi:DUF6243 family protein [Stackebrandtia nassauensis]|uniref:Uncharacterized protein n=1 Tax=Stackebrandtia nassauensis (strain DSM 44728 / CIP 108903 / NRRL B-16338 / NBRC 102104 / LLR-40K-21) TaxID=446470 RepID=D3PZJ6_STANL|nr:DUF6243 family protein [Stackebrandtia nassauensis]ADD41670.1 hypothetical protein Snas_1974 [Stackebrandtia nassauensis DSM 44728]
MSKGRGNDMLGVGGQRRKLSKNDLRGKGFGGGKHGHDPMAAKRELIQRLQAKRGSKR